MFTRRGAIDHMLLGGAASFAALAFPDIGLGAEGIVSLHGAGSTFSAPLYKSWIKVFEQATTRSR
jgi:ABC-type phosphate transport system substrate-binding protein